MKSSTGNISVNRSIKNKRQPIRADAYFINRYNIQ